MTDIMSGAGLWIFPSIALVLFLIIFSLAVWRTFSRHAAATHEHLSRLPLSEGAAPNRNARSDA